MPPAEARMDLPIYEYGRSYLQFTTDLSNHTPRMQLEASCRLTDLAGHDVDYVLTADCMSERMYRPAGLVVLPASLFWLISGSDGTFMMQKRHAQSAADIREIHRVGETMSAHDGKRRLMLKIEVHCEPATQPRRLAAYADIRRAILGNQPLGGRTTYSLPGGFTVQLGYPIKTCNIPHGHEAWQMDTGPILWPDPVTGAARGIAALESAFILFNAPDWAEIAVRRPIAADGGQATHFSEIIRLEKVRNEIFAL